MNKMKIVAYKDDAFDERVAEYFVHVNPSEFSQTTIVTYGDRPWLTVTAADGKVVLPSKEPEPEKMEFLLIFDATGVLIVDGKPLKTPIDKQLKQFKDAVLDNGKPRYVQLEYGPIIFKCRLESMSVTYTLFRPNGSTLRASANVKFYEEKPNWGKRAANALARHNNSCKTVGSGDVVDVAAEELYQDQHAYIKVAKDNKVKFFRSLVPGMLLKK